MINQSTEIVRNRLIELDYKYIIIDEYQDISKSRFIPKADKGAWLYGCGN